MAVVDHPDRLPNLGNTCFLNAVVQGPSAISSLRPLLSDNPLVCPTLVEFDNRVDTLGELAQALGYNPSKGIQEDAHECFSRWLELVPSRGVYTRAPTSGDRHRSAFVRPGRDPRESLKDGRDRSPLYTGRIRFPRL